uniref:Sugar phosphate transporter domain-containing protein n=1 Tax=Globisporangium ultimum (strain ATCC 200006 / CBS 805.95 / DAOM BR144) TaxID=431595 RepID=K3WKP5_GLOUD
MLGGAAEPPPSVVTSLFTSSTLLQTLLRRSSRHNSFGMSVNINVSAALSKHPHSDADLLPVDDGYQKGHEVKRSRVNKSLLIVIHLATWYCFSASATFTNKVLIKQHHVSAEMLTLSHLFVSVICDFIVLTFPNTRGTSNTFRMQSISLRSLLWILPLSLCSVTAKVLTYWSYNAVPVAIAHTCKASQPFFNVILAYLAYRSKFSLATYVSLVPIVLGVVLASVSEMGMNNLAFSGAVFAITSALIGVMQSMYAKFLLRNRIVIDSINLHFYNAFVSFAINAPIVMFNTPPPHVDKLPQSFPYMTVALCSLMHFVGSFCSSLVLGEVSELTFSIMSTMKRVVIILSAVFYFGNPVTTQSVLGMLLAVGGVGAYQIIKLHDKKDKSPLPLPV